jgi:uncharacterized membrane protein
MRHRGQAIGLAFALASGFCLATSSTARADFRACNETDHGIGLALAHSNGSDWVSEGWWTIAPHTCVSVLVGPLKARYYYVHAVHFDVGGGWMGDRSFCTRRRGFTVTGRDRCEERGYQRSGFFEVDTQNAADYTHVLTERSNTSGSVPQ